MRRLKTYIICLGLLVMAFPVKRAFALDGVSGKAGGFVEFFNEDEDNAKFNEYRYKQDDEFGGQAYIDVFMGPVDGQGEHQIQGDFLWRSPEDFDAELEHLWYGVVRGNVEYKRFGHNFAFDVLTLHTGQGTGVLSIPDTIQTLLQSKPNSSPQLAQTLESLIPNSNKIDLQLRRDRLEGDLEIFAVKPFTMRMGFDYEEREGSRPYGGTFGFGNAIEIAEPLDYATTNIWAELEYRKDPFFGNVKFFHSTFNTEIESLTYDNPFRITDSTSAICYIQNTGCGPVMGRNALPPDNYMNGFTVTLAHDLPLHSRVTSTATFQWNRQDENLLPATTNTAVDFQPLPRASADAKVDTELYTVKWAAHPIDKLHVMAGFRYYSHENRTVVDTFPHVRTDAVLEDEEPFNNVNVSYIMRTLEGELAYEVIDRTTVTLTYELEGNSFENGSADKENIQIYEAAIDSRALPWLRVQLSTTLTDKNSLYKDNDPAHSEVPFQRKYYAATKDRFAAHAMGTVMVNDALSVTMDYTYGQDDYDFSPLGLKESRDHAGTISADLSLDSWMTFSAWYTYENFKSTQESREWSSSAPTCSPLTGPQTGLDSFCDWTLESTDNIHTVGFATHIIILPGKLTADADGVFTTVNAKADFESPLGIAGVNDRNAYIPQDFNQVDETKLAHINGKMTYSINKDLDIFGGFTWEDWQIEDYQYDGLRQVVTNASSNYNALLVMDSLYKDYTVGTAYVGLEWRFGQGGEI